LFCWDCINVEITNCNYSTVPKQGKILSLINQPVFIQSETWVKNHQYQDLYRIDTEYKVYQSILSISNMATKYTFYFTVIIYFKVEIFFVFLSLLLSAISCYAYDRNWSLTPWSAVVTICTTSFKFRNPQFGHTKYICVLCVSPPQLTLTSVPSINQVVFVRDT
jgi:hypothetical protein